MGWDGMGWLGWDRLVWAGVGCSGRDHRVCEMLHFEERNERDSVFKQEQLSKHSFSFSFHRESVTIVDFGRQDNNGCESLLDVHLDLGKPLCCAHE